MQVPGNPTCGPLQERSRADEAMYRGSVIDSPAPAAGSIGRFHQCARPLATPVYVLTDIVA